MTTERAREPLTNASFTSALVLDLANEFQAVVGPRRTREAVGLVGLEMGERMEEPAAEAAGVDVDAEWSPHELARVLVALKDRIDGGFRIERVDGDEIVLRNSRCPFGDGVRGRDSLCMMTSSVFGGIAARRFGRAQVSVDEAIARGDAECAVRVRLRPKREDPGEWSIVYHGEDAGGPAHGPG